MKLLPSSRRTVSSMVEHSSANPKVPGLIPGPVSYRGSQIMMRHVKCILLLKWSTTFQRLWVYRIRKEKGATPGILSTIDGSTLPQDCHVCGRTAMLNTKLLVKNTIKKRKSFLWTDCIPGNPISSPTLHPFGQNPSSQSRTPSFTLLKPC